MIVMPTGRHWEHEDIPTLTTIVVVGGGGPSGWMSEQMREQMEMEPTQESYERYCIQPIHEYEYWKEVINAIIQSPHW